MRSTLAISILAAASVAASPALAQSTGAAAAIAAQPTARAGTLESARRLIEVMHIDQSYERIFKPLVGVLAAGVLPSIEKDGDVPEAVREELATDEGKARVGKLISEEFLAAFRARYPQLKEATAKEYAAAFTEDELQAVIAFYSSGVGAKVLTLAPVISAKIQVQARAIGEDAGKDAYRRILDRLDSHRTS